MRPKAKQKGLKAKTHVMLGHTSKTYKCDVLWRIKRETCKLDIGCIINKLFVIFFSKLP